MRFWGGIADIGASWGTSALSPTPMPSRTGAVAFSVNAAGYSKLYLLRVRQRRDVETPQGIIGNFQFTPDGRQLGLTLSRPQSPAGRPRAVAEGVREGAPPTGTGKELLAELVERGGDPAALVDARGLRQVSDGGALEPVVAEIMAKHADKVAQYRGGKVGLLGFFVGQVVKASGGKANPATVNELVQRALGGA